MKKIIVTTTINEPTAATLKYCAKKEWIFVIAGDLKTPHQAYRDLEKQFNNVYYLDPEEQAKKYKKLSDIIGWKTIQRRNIALIEAYNLGAEIVATIDDDNVPYDNWGKDIHIGKEIDCDLYKTELPVFDPLSVTADNHLWHRGYPIELLKDRHNFKYAGKVKRRPLIQANLWEGDPDIDAIARLTFRPEVEYSDILNPYCSNKISPFNSQNTFLAREILPYYAVLPFVGRMDDIWISYIVQHIFPDSVIYDKPTVYQDRNKQDLITNLENEILGYRDTIKLVKDLGNFEKYLPEKTRYFYQAYKEFFVKNK